MTKIDVYSGFLGAGKTTLIKKMISESYAGQKLVLIENEFGEIGIDGGFLQDAGINITEMNSGCICCSLVGDFGKALTQVIAEYNPDRIVIEPSGVGKLFDVVAAVEKVTNDEVKLDCTVAVVDAGKVKVYMKNFGEFYNNQIETADTIVLSRTDSVSGEKLDKAVELLREHNADATIVTTPWSQLTGEQLMEAMEGKAKVAADLKQMEEEHHHHHEESCCGGHHHGEHHHHDHEEGCCCGGHHHGEHHHHDHEEGCCCGGHHHGEHHHHDHEEGCCCGGHHHEEHHHHGEHCGCGHHHDHHDHHADEVFTAWGVETHKQFTVDTIKGALEVIDSGTFGQILRAKGIVSGEDGNWIHFDYVPGEVNVRLGAAAVTGKLCVIGADIEEDKIAKLFGV